MRGVVYLGPRRVVVADDLPEPVVAGPRDAVVRVTRTAICGTDLHPYLGEIPDFGVGTVLGHEFTGVVEDAGPEVPFAPGQRVLASDIVACGRCAACARGWHYHCPEVTLFGYSTVVGRPVAGGQAERVLVPFADVVLSACPPDLTDEQVLFAGDILTTGFTAAARAAIVPGSAVAVIGAGPVGLLGALCASVLGAAAVVVSDPDARRRDLASSLGLLVAEPAELGQVVRAASGSALAASVIEAVGSDAALADALEAVGPRGTVVAVGAHHSRAMPFATGTAFAREITLRFAVGDPIASRDQVLALVGAGRIDPTAIVSHRLPLAEAPLAYELFAGREATKVVLVPEAG
jgi:2-desacetyl-2-hydroxyethyl bacteriochlorophyllide A dehydrogenase